MRNKKIVLALLLAFLCSLTGGACGLTNGAQSVGSQDEISSENGEQESVLPKDASFSVNVGEAPDAVSLGGCTFVDVKYQGEVLPETEYIVKNGYFAFTYETYAEMGTNLNEYTITVDKGSFNLSYFVSGYQGTFTELGGENAFVINEDMTGTLASDEYDVFIKGKSIQLKQNGEVKKEGHFSENVVILDKVYGKDTFENSLSLIADIQVETKELKMFDSMADENCQIHYTLVEGNKEISIDELTTCTLDGSKEYQLKTNFKVGDINTALVTPIETTPFESIDFAKNQEKYQLFNEKVENKTYAGEEVLALQGMTLLDNKWVNIAKASGHWTMTVDIFVPTQEAASSIIFMAHGYKEGGNIYNALPQGNYFCSGNASGAPANASFVNLGNYKGVWHTLYLDTTRFHTDNNNPENIYFTLMGCNEIYMKNVKFHYVQQDLSKELDLKTYGKYMVIPTFTGSVRGSSPASWDETNKRLVLTNADNVANPYNGYSLLQGYLAKGEKDGYKNIDIDFGSNGTETRIGQYYLWHWQGLGVFDTVTTESSVKSYDLAKINNRINPVTNEEIGLSSLEALSREDVRLTIQAYQSAGSCSAYVNKISFSK